jgi:hypothetical protein
MPTRGKKQNIKREEALDREAYRKGCSDQQQLAILANRPGNATKERTRLQERINKN